MSISANPKSIKALALDLDGTILRPESVLSERTVRVLKACKSRGIHIIIATGRAIDAAEPFREALEASGPAVYFNGAVTADMPGGKITSATLLDTKTAEFCVDLSREMGVYFQAFLPESGTEISGAHNNPRITLMADSERPEWKVYHNYTGIKARPCDLKQALSRPGLRGCVKGMYVAAPEVQAALRARLEEHFGGNVYLVQTSGVFLEVLNPEASKGRGLKTVMEQLSLGKEEVLAFGDEENDLPLFAAAGFSAAPSNAKDAVKAAAGIVIGSNAHDGVAAFLEDFFAL